MHDIDRVQMEAFEFEAESEFESVMSESELNELASELLEVTSEAELEQFLGSLIKKAGKAVGGFIKSPTGKALGGLLKGAAKQALPIVGGALGGVVGGPAGAAIGSNLAGMAGKAFGLELEYESEDEFETAKSFVKMAADAAKTVAAAPTNANPQAVAKAAVAQAAKVHLPKLLGAVGGPATGAKSGRWIRRGSTIVIYGV